MKRFFKNSFFVILVLVSLVGSASSVTSAHAQAQSGSMQIVPLNLPSGWKYGYLRGIWGSGANDIYAVGYGDNGSTLLQPLLYHKDSTGWTSAALPLPGGWSTGYLYGVWGSSATDIFAVGTGNVGIGSVDLPLLYRWNGSTWSAATLPLPSGWGAGILTSVWGSSASNVFAAGYGWSGSASQPLVYHWNGSIWSSFTPGLPGGWTSGYLYGMWGSTSNSAYAVGLGNNGAIWPMLYTWNGSSWNESTPSLPLPTGWTSGNLKGIWGSADNNIYAVGSGFNGAVNAPLLQHWNGSVWTASSELSLPADVTEGYLTGIWGSSASDIYAVGYGFKGTTTVPLLYHKGSSPEWQDSSPSHPTGWLSDHLYGVWGSSFNDVSVVGSGHNGSNDMPLLYHSSQVEQDVLAPGNVTNLAATTGTTSSSVKLTWTAPADDAGNDSSGSVASYLVKYSDSPFTDWTQGTPVTTGVAVPTAPGTSQTMIVSGLVPNTQYYFAVRAQDEQYNLSAEPVPVASATASGIIHSTWYVSSLGNFPYGEQDDIPVVADYNGDGRADIAVFRPSNNIWYVSSLGNFLYGTEGDIPVVGDYNGDGRDDVAVFRPSKSTWYISSVNSFVWGMEGDIPVVADYNGDGRDDVAVFRPSNSTWYIVGMGAAFVWGIEGDIPVVADYNGDGRDDVAVFRPSNSTWYIVGMGAAFVWGMEGDIPVVGDYNGDGRDDVAVFRP